MRSILALMRASFLTATSYRLSMMLSVVGLAASFVPLYFVSGALQPLVAESIRAEGGEYFGFLAIGVAATFLLTSAVSTVPAMLGGTIATGTFEALIITRTPLSYVILGLSGYSMLWSTLRAALMLAGAAVLGATVSLSAVPAVLLIAALLVVAYFAIGLVAGALVLVFRTSGPVTTMAIAASGLLGGVYYSTTVIPSWLQYLSAIVPLTYALRPMRMLLLGNATFAQAVPDVLMLTAFATGLLGISIIVFQAALRHARKSGTLAQY